MSRECYFCHRLISDDEQHDAERCYYEMTEAGLWTPPPAPEELCLQS